MSLLVYVAEPIDQAPHPFARKIPDVEGWTLFRPAEAFDSTAPGPEIERVNRQVLAGSDGLLAFLKKGQPTIGVPAEIEWALANGLPVAIVTDYEQSVAIQGFKDRGATVHWGVDDACSTLEDQMAGQVGPDTLGFVRTRPDAQLPTKGYPDDAGMDLYSCIDVTVLAHEFRDIPCGVVANLPPGTWGLIVGRSSTLRRQGLWAYQGVIDASFRGELMTGVWNTRSEAVQVSYGDRLGQLIVMPASPLRPVWVPEIVPGTSNRGQNGFGSTGA